MRTNRRITHVPQTTQDIPNKMERNLCRRATGWTDHPNNTYKIRTLNLEEISLLHSSASLENPCLRLPKAEVILNVPAPKSANISPVRAEVFWQKTRKSTAAVEWMARNPAHIPTLAYPRGITRYCLGRNLRGVWTKHSCYPLLCSTKDHVTKLLALL